MKLYRLLSAMLGLVVLFGLAGISPATANTTGEEPVIDWGELVHGEAGFTVDANEFSKAALKTKSGQKIYLNIQATPMTPEQIKPGTCRTAPVGKVYYNQVIDPATGKLVFKRMTVQAGDNVFCMGRDGEWRKKSCGNPAQGIFGVPKPPKSLIRIRGVVRDYLAASGSIAGHGELEGHAYAHVEQYDGERKVCEAEGQVHGKGSGMYKAWIKVRTRSLTSFLVEAERQATVKLSTSSTVKGKLVGKLRLDLEGHAYAMCNYTPPPPAHDECPDIPGDQPEGYECEPPTTDTPSASATADVCTAPGGTAPNTVVVRGTSNDDVTRTLVFKVTDSAGTTKTAERSVTAGGSDTVSFSGLALGNVTYSVTVKETGKFFNSTTRLNPCPPTNYQCPPGTTWTDKDGDGKQDEGECYTDRKPAVNIMGSPAHLYVGGNAYIWIEASDPDGDAVSVQVSASGAGTVSGLVPSSVRWDGTPCPTGKSCFRATAWAGNTPGNMTITATVTANGVQGEPDSVTFPVKADEF